MRSQLEVKLRQVFKDVHITDCIFMNTDRGLRVKTRRGRGQLSVLDDISFENIDMDNVMTPFVVNSFYFCDPDGKTEYVGTKKPLPVDRRTPSIKRLTFKDIKATNCHVAVRTFMVCRKAKLKSLPLRISASLMRKMQNPA